MALIQLMRLFMRLIMRLFSVKPTYSLGITGYGFGLRVRVQNGVNIGLRAGFRRIASLFYGLFSIATGIDAPTVLAALRPTLIKQFSLLQVI